MENYSIGLMYQFESNWYSKSWLESKVSDARRDAERELSKKLRGIKLEIRTIAPGVGSGTTIKENIAELIEKLDLVIFEFSDNNPNVMIEFGIRLRSQKPYLIIKNEEADTPLPSNVSNEFCLLYSTNNQFFSGQLAGYILKTADAVYIPVETKLESGKLVGDQVSFKKKTWLFQEKLFEIFVDYKATVSLMSDFYRDVQNGYINEKFRYTGIDEAIAWRDLCLDRQYRPYWDSIDLLEDQMPELLAYIFLSDKVSQVDFVCLGVGSGLKEKVILDNLLQMQDDLNLYLVDASIEMLGLSLSYYVSHLKNYEDRISAVGILSDLNSRPGTKPNVFPERRPSLFALLGNTLGNYSEQSLLRSVRGMMEKGDFIMIDAQLLPKNIVDDEIEKEIRKSYDNKLFKKFVMTPLQRVGVGEHDGIVELSIPHNHPEGLRGRAFAVRYNWIFSKEVNGHCGEVPITFSEGSQIGLGFSVKYDIDLFSTLITNSGLKILTTFLAPNNYYGIVLAQRTQ